MLKFNAVHASEKKKENLRGVLLQQSTFQIDIQCDLTSTPQR